MPSAFQQYALSLAPTWLQGPFGQGYMNALGALLDALVDREKLANKADMPLVAPPDGLARTGSERGLPRGNSETDASYAVRLQSAWSTWLFAGTARGVLRALYDGGYPNTAVVQQLGTTYELDPGTTNLLTRSEQFSASPPWTIQFLTVVDGNAAAPDGTISATTLTDTTDNQLHRLFQGAGTVTVGALTTTSFYAKAGTLVFISVAETASAHSATFNLSTGVVSATSGTGTTATMLLAGNGFYRCMMTFPASFASPGCILSIGDTSAHATTAWAGSGSGTVFLWRSQLEALPFATAYVRSDGAQASRAADPNTLITITSPRWTFDNQSPPSNPSVWALSTVYTANKIVVPSPMNGFYYETVSGGTSAGSQPTFPTTVGQTVQDNTATWCCRGRDFWSRFAVMFFTPFPASWSGVPPAYASAEVTRIRGLINQWKPAFATCVEAIAVITPGVWGFQDGTWGDGGLWGGTSTIWTPI